MCALAQARMGCWALTVTRSQWVPCARSGAAEAGAGFPEGTGVRSTQASPPAPGRSLTVTVLQATARGWPYAHHAGAACAFRGFKRGWRDIWGQRGWGQGPEGSGAAGQLPGPGSSPPTRWRGALGGLAQAEPRLDGNLAHPLQVSILLSLPEYSFCACSFSRQERSPSG